MDNIKTLMTSFKVIPNTNNYLNNSIKQFKLGEGRINNLSHPYLDYGSVVPHKIASGENLLNSIVKNKDAFKTAKKLKVPFSHFDVKQNKPIQIEKAFGDMITTSDVQPYQHKNPQKYQYHLNKYDIKDIAMKRLEIEGGGTNEFSRIYKDFSEMYERQFEDNDDSWEEGDGLMWGDRIPTESNIPIAPAFGPYIGPASAMQMASGGGGGSGRGRRS